MSQPADNRSLNCAWCWQRKQVLELIRQTFAATDDVPSALATYLALTEIASNEQNDRFVTTQLWIAGKAGLSPRTTGKHLKAFVDLGIIEMTVPKLRGPATFNLNTDAKLFPNDTQPLPNVTQPAASKRPLPTSEESNEQSSEESSNNGGNKAPPAAKPFISELKIQADAIQQLIDQTQDLEQRKDLRKRLRELKYKIAGVEPPTSEPVKAVKLIQQTQEPVVPMADAVKAMREAAR